MLSDSFKTVSFSGVKVIFKAALVIMKFSLDNRATLKNCPTMYETLEVLRNPPPEILEEYFLIPHVSSR